MKFLSFLSNWWCYKTHPTPMWPVLGKYRCPKCLRQYPVPWEHGRNRFHVGKSVQPVRETLSAATH